MDASKVRIFFYTVFGKIFSILGYFLGSVFLIALLVELTDGKQSEYSFGYTASMYLVFLGLAGFLIFKGITIKNRIKRFKKYVGLISIEHITSLQNIASSINQSLDFVTKDIQKLINKKFFSNAYLDIKNGKIIIKKPNFQQASVILSQNAKAETEQVKCNSCGANNIKVKGIMGNCEYCESPLK